MSTLNIPFFIASQKTLNYPWLPSWPCTIVNPQWLELPMFETSFRGSKDFQTIEVQLYSECSLLSVKLVSILR